MRTLLLAGLLALAFPAVAGAPKLTAAQIEDAPVYLTRVDSRIVIDPEGRIARYQPKTQLPSRLGAEVERMVRGIRFVPVEVEGRAVTAETDLRVAIAAEKLPDGGMKLTLDNVTFPLAEDEARRLTRGAVVHRSPLEYPSAALRVGAEADVVVAIRFDAAGNAVESAVRQSALVDGQGRRRNVAAVLDLFEQASAATSRHWKVDPAAMPACSRVGDGFVGNVLFTYRIDRDAAPAEPGKWTLQFRTVKRTPPWTRAVDGVASPGVADLADGEMGFTNSRFRLAQPLSAAGS